jgi:hypothetical protein
VNTPENRLRLQKFEIALLDEEMLVIKTVQCATSDRSEETQVATLIGQN